MAPWAMTKEPDLDDLLNDAVMQPVVRSAGLSHAELRRSLVETSRRLRSQRDGDPSGYRAAFWELRAIR
jgi:hypothetical protein